MQAKNNHYHFVRKTTYRKPTVILTKNPIKKTTKCEQQAKKIKGAKNRISLLRALPPRFFISDICPLFFSESFFVRPRKSKRPLVFLGGSIFRELSCFWVRSLYFFLEIVQPLVLTQACSHWARVSSFSVYFVAS